MEPSQNIPMHIIRLNEHSAIKRLLNYCSNQPYLPLNRNILPLTSGLTLLTWTVLFIDFSVYFMQMQGSNVFVTSVAPGPVVTNAGVNALQADGTTFSNHEKFLTTGMTVQRYHTLF